MAAVSFALIAGCAVTTSVDTMSPTRAAQAADINAEIAVYHLEQGNTLLAREKADKALQQNPQSIHAHLVSAEIESRLGDVNAEAWHYEQALNIEPQNPSALNNFAGFLCRESQIQAAIEIYERVANDRRYGQRALVLTNAGRCLFEANHWVEAKEYWQRALAEASNYPPALFGLAEAELALGSIDAARAYFSRYTLEVGETSDKDARRIARFRTHLESTL